MFPTNLKSKFLRDGKVKEMLLASLIGAKLSTLEDDYKGVDIELNITIDVKGQKKVLRSDDQVSDLYHWIELRKNSEMPGWVCSGAMFLAFETAETWMIVDRERLFNWVKIKLGDYSDTPEVYKRYQRNESVLTLIPVDDLRSLMVVELEKN